MNSNLSTTLSAKDSTPPIGNVLLPAALSLVQSRNIHDYKPILQNLIDDFGFTYYHAILIWCKILDDDEDENKYWQVYLIKWNDETVGICGLYSQYANTTDELWLGWFGIIPTKRNDKIGQHALNWMKENAKSIGCKKLMSYVDEHGKPLPFYYRNGFTNIGTVKEYLSTHTELSIKSFENENDHIIECLLS